MTCADCATEAYDGVEFYPEAPVLDQGMYRRMRSGSWAIPAPGWAGGPSSLWRMAAREITARTGMPDRLPSGDPDAGRYKREFDRWVRNYMQMISGHRRNALFISSSTGLATRAFLPRWDRATRRTGRGNAYGQLFLPNNRRFFRRAKYVLNRLAFGS